MMIRYKSTRGNRKMYSFSEAILKGIAGDGGLFVPEVIPKFSLQDLNELTNKSYHEIAIFLLNLFQPDFSNKKVKEIVYKAYSTNFDKAEITPLIHLRNNQYLLELWHGPTSAFKDLALQIMSLFFSEAAKKVNNKRLKKGKKSLKYLILVATSGDTGKAALEGYKDKENISIAVFYPDGHVSKLQELQMVTQKGSNLAVYAVKGDFDATQKIVKDIFNDRDFNKSLFKQFHTVLSSANSINWGRIISQIIYYVYSYIQLVNKKVIRLGEKIDVAVPTGNFGNILAAYYAMKMGLPIKKFICASNANNVLTEFLQTGVYDVSKRALIQTPSPSMDILISSNIERLLYIITKNSKIVSQWMNMLKTEGKFEVDDATKLVLQERFYADWISNEDCLFDIKKIYKENNYLMDPHTSVAQVVVQRYLQQNSITVPVIICATAHWAKFVKYIYKSLVSKEKSTLNEFEILKEINKLVPNSKIPYSIRYLQKMKVRYTEKCNAGKELIEMKIIKLLKNMTQMSRKRYRSDKVC